MKAITLLESITGIRDKYILKTVEYIENNYADSISVQKLLELAKDDNHEAGKLKARVEEMCLFNIEETATLTASLSLSMK